ncbi:hypothetical protein [Sphingosinicella sp. CPCC 101087]|uniref:hypothetical protein n=1 Tax=Sphingosinicella sp. CPCC 101087 TaxID=2497754 RepID=UPI00101D49A1|nr:hypothetical protein [Sphingosinicella sp. CPCC 101087]
MRKVLDDERSYFRIRAEQEIRAAQAASHPEAARAHYMMAGYYLDLAHNPEAAAPPPPFPPRLQPVRQAKPDFRPVQVAASAVAA